MAASDAAVPSTVTGRAADRRGSPQPASQSKRDRKRQALMERLASMNDKFQRERDMTYRDQLQKIQFDTNLVQRFDPYDPKVLEVISEMQKEHKQTQGPPVNAEDARSLLDMAGIRFSDFIDEVEDLVEIRDFQLAQSKNEYERRLQEYKNTYAYKVETAKREHRALTSTLRDRLINTLTQKKNRLNREKEVLEINDSNALLLNPNQFSLTNPSSPGGTHGKRATRLRKDADDMYSDNKKRKRNPGDDDGSPVPMRRALDPNNTTPLWQSEKARAAAKQNGPAYSIDKLFTDKELSLNYNTAALAAHQYILRNRVSGSGSSPEDTDSGNGNDNGDDADSQPSAPMMERSVSHATRSTRGGANHNFLDDKILGIEGIANFEVPGNLDLIHAQEPPKMPPPVPQQYLKPYPRSADQNFPTPLSQDDIMSDLSVMGYFKQYDQSHKPGAHLDAQSGLRKVLEAVATPYQEGRFVALTGASREDPELLRDTLGLPAISSLRDQPSPAQAPSVAALSGAAAAPMSRQSSLGGVAMSRQGTGGSARGKGRKN
ncbi:putative deacetylase complex subunit Sds3 [Ilyonectria robusta]|uniref:putative deacetylase complex subunit Sds3 n=1 Tax=Ilyonectria robusta TaxID=1079257 RepID=UPI001E8EEFE1|nr:putative deacetylase complex subunit Sds3 [Ilyonectria robusta]KAH8735098.1 putative deacetylase complex subunit Sds3 [Ilyonectria robusta]